MGEGLSIALKEMIMVIIGKQNPSGTVLFARLKVEVRTPAEEANSIDASDKWDEIMDKIEDILKSKCPQRWYVTFNDD